MIRFDNRVNLFKTEVQVYHLYRVKQVLWSPLSSTRGIGLCRSKRGNRLGLLDQPSRHTNDWRRAKTVDYLALNSLSGPCFSRWTQRMLRNCNIDWWRSFWHYGHHWDLLLYTTEHRTRRSQPHQVSCSPLFRKIWISSPPHDFWPRIWSFRNQGCSCRLE